MTRDISAAVEAHWDFKQAQDDDAHELAVYLEENNITEEQHKAAVRQAQEDAAADADLYGDMT